MEKIRKTFLLTFSETNFKKLFLYEEAHYLINLISIKIILIINYKPYSLTKSQNFLFLMESSFYQLKNKIERQKSLSLKVELF